MWRQNRIYKGRNGGVYPVRNHVISFENVVKQFDDEPVLKNVSFEIEEGKELIVRPKLGKSYVFDAESEAFITKC